MSQFDFRPVPGLPDEYVLRVPRPTTLVIRCKFADRLDDRPGEPVEPTPEQGYPAYFTSAGTQGIYSYLNAQMMGTTGYEATISPWYVLSLTEQDAVRIRASDRLGIVQYCADAAAGDFDISRFRHLVVILNAPSAADGSGGGDFTGAYPYPVTIGKERRDFGVTIIGSSGFDMNGVLQEMLHGYPVGGFTMPHGRHAYVPGMASNSEYGDPYDVMSAFNNYKTQGPWGAQGACLSGARRELAGWVPEDKKVEYIPDDSVSYPELRVELQPLAADVPGVKLIKIPVGDNGLHYYTIEYRTPFGWDLALPTHGILIYEVRPDRIAYLMTRRGGVGAEWEAQRGTGDIWRAPLWGTTVNVVTERAEPDGSTVRLFVGS